jgi:hypothetical protein
MSEKLVVATYTKYMFFKIPKDIDLDNKEQVESWHVKYNTLYINLVKSETIEVKVSYEDEDNYKYPDTVKIEDKDEYEFLDELNE